MKVFKHSVCNLHYTLSLSVYSNIQGIFIEIVMAFQPLEAIKMSCAKLKIEGRDYKSITRIITCSKALH